MRDPIDDFDKYEREQYQWLMTRPVCDECGDPIQDEYGYRIGIRLYCPNCINEFKEYIDDEWG